jgi:hypothetical protein
VSLSVSAWVLRENDHQPNVASPTTMIVAAMATALEGRVACSVGVETVSATPAPFGIRAGSATGKTNR